MPRMKATRPSTTNNGAVAFSAVATSTGAVLNNNTLPDPTAAGNSTITTKTTPTQQVHLISSDDGKPYSIRSGFAGYPANATIPLSGYTQVESAERTHSTQHTAQYLQQEQLEQDHIVEVNSASTTKTMRAKRKQLQLMLANCQEQAPPSPQPGVHIAYNNHKHSAAMETSSSSEFPVSSHSNPQVTGGVGETLDGGGRYQKRLALLKNTLPADALERGLALLGAGQPQMSLEEKMAAWQCEADVSDVEDVHNFEDRMQLYKHIHNSALGGGANSKRSPSPFAVTEKPSTSSAAASAYVAAQQRRQMKSAFESAQDARKRLLAGDQPQNGVINHNSNNKVKSPATTTSTENEEDLPKKKKKPLLMKNIATTNNQASLLPSSIGGVVPVQPTKLLPMRQVLHDAAAEFYQLRRREMAGEQVSGSPGLIQLHLDFSGVQKTALQQSGELFKTPHVPRKYLQMPTKRYNNNNDYSNREEPHDTVDVVDSAAAAAHSKSKVMNGMGKGQNVEAGRMQGGAAIHQQHEFCNYLGLTGLSTSTAVAEAAAELARNYPARRSLRVQRQQQKEKTGPRPAEAPQIKQVCVGNRHVCRAATDDEAPPLYNSGLVTALRTTTPSPTEDPPQVQILCRIPVDNSESVAELALRCCVKQLVAPIRQRLLRRHQLKVQTTRTSSNGTSTCPRSSQHSGGEEDDEDEEDEEEETAELTTKGVELEEAVGIPAIQSSAETKVAAAAHGDCKSSHRTPVSSSNATATTATTYSQTRSEQSNSPFAQRMLRLKMQTFLANARQSKPSIFIVDAFASAPSRPATPAKQSVKQSADKPATPAARAVKPQRSFKKLAPLKTMNGSGVITRHQQQQLRRLLTRSAAKMKSAQLQQRSRQLFVRIPPKRQLKRSAQPEKKPPVERSTQIKEQLPSHSPESPTTTTTVVTVARITTASRTTATKAKTITTPAATACNELPIIEAVFSSSRANSNSLYDEPLPPPNSECELARVTSTTTTLVAPSYPAAAVDDCQQIYCNDAFMLNKSASQMAVTLAASSTTATKVSTTAAVSTTETAIFVGQEQCSQPCALPTLATPPPTTTQRPSPPPLPASPPTITQRPNPPLPPSPPTTTQRPCTPPLPPSPPPPRPRLMFKFSSTGGSATGQQQKNPLDLASHGPVLYIYYEQDVLIVVQEQLISFWQRSSLIQLLSMCSSWGAPPKEGPSLPPKLAAKAQHNNNYWSPVCAGKEASPGAADTGNEWHLLGECRHLATDTEVQSPYANRICIHNSQPIYVELRCRALPHEKRDCSLLSLYINVYYYNEEEMIAKCHSIALDSVQSPLSNVVHTTISESRYFVIAWSQQNILGKTRTGLCKYSLTPHLDTLASIREFKSLRHEINHLESINDDQLLGFGHSQLTIWDHRSGDELMNYDLEVPIGHYLGCQYFPSWEKGQNNMLLLYQYIAPQPEQGAQPPKGPELLLIACSLSHATPSHRVLRLSLPEPAFSVPLKAATHNGEYLLLTAANDEELWLSGADPHAWTHVQPQHTQRFYARNNPRLVEVTPQTLSVYHFAHHVLKLAQP